MIFQRLFFKINAFKHISFSKNFFIEREQNSHRATVRYHSRFCRNRTIPPRWYISAPFSRRDIFQRKIKAIAARRGQGICLCKPNCGTTIQCLLSSETYFFVSLLFFCGDTGDSGDKVLIRLIFFNEQSISSVTFPVTKIPRVVTDHSRKFLCYRTCHHCHQCHRKNKHTPIRK